MTSMDVPWPPLPDSSNTSVVRMVEERLTGLGLSATGIAVTGAAPWAVMVELSEPLPADTVSALRARLAPVLARLVWYIGTAEEQPDRDPGNPDVERPCGVCGQPAAHRHLLDRRQGFHGTAIAAEWWLCQECHLLVVAGESEALTRRFADADLDLDTRAIIADGLAQSRTGDTH